MPFWRFLGAIALTLWAVPAFAQRTFDEVGIRALGMAGAFVGVADDATAVFWNPAGLATAGPIGATIGSTRLRFGNFDAPPESGPLSHDSEFSSIGSWPLGVSYERRRTRTLGTDSLGQVQAASFETVQLGVTILQSIAEGVVIGSTLKYVRGRVGSEAAFGSSAGDALDSVGNVETKNGNAFDFDLGVMIDMKRVRFGLASRNMREPAFTDLAGTETRLKRAVRIGLGVLPTDGLTLAIDLDLDTVDLRGDLRRVIAFGGENRLGKRLAIRAGVRRDLEGSGRVVGAMGASVVIRQGLWLEGYVARGAHDGERGFGIGLRAGS